MKGRLFVLSLVVAIGALTIMRFSFVARAATSIRLAESESDEQSSDDAPRTIPAPSVNTAAPVTTIPAAVNSSPTISVPTVTNTVTPTTTSTPTETSSAPSAGAVATASTPVANPFPWAWITTRAAGIASYILLGLLSVTGMFLTTGILFRIMSPSTAWSLHRAIGSVLLFSVLLHVGALLFDTFIGLKLKDVLIPFVSIYKPLYMGLGIIGFYLLLLVLATSLYTMTGHAKFWRFVHAFSFPMFVLIFLHSFFLGTDSKTWWMHTIYWGSAILVGLAVFYRLMWKYRNLDAASS